jgi:hypothetical protein
VSRILDIAICVLTASLLLIAATGGIDVDAGLLHVRVHDWTRPLALLLLAAAARVWSRRLARRRTGRERRTTADLARYVANVGMLALVLAAVGIYARYHMRSAGGLDSYGYVSAARLLASGRIREPQPLAALLPFEDALSAATPLGHVPSADGRTSVPRFPLGLPAVMALFMVFGPQGVYFVPIAMACIALVLAYLLGRETPDGGRTHPSATRHMGGLLAAALLAEDPLFAAYAIQPMSDVPAACWLLGSVWLALRSDGSRNALSSVAGGVCAGMAMLTRPALMPAVIALVFVASRSRRWRSVIPLGGTVAAFIAFQFALNMMLFGGATASGYGTTSHMFEVSVTRLAANAANFGKWLTYSHTPVFWVLWPMALWILRAHTWAWQVSLVAAAGAAPYFFYIVFDDWESSRFLLPSIALVIVLFARALSHVLRDLPLSPLLMLALAAGSGAASHVFLKRHAVDVLANAEAKFPLAGEWFASHTPDRAVALAALHSGPIRLYGRRPTIRWDHIPHRSLRPTITALIAAGYEPYLVLDLPSEPALFDARFAGDTISIEQVARVRVVNIYKFVSAH